MRGLLKCVTLSGKDPERTKGGNVISHQHTFRTLPTIPWIRSVERICGRSRPNAVCAMVSASAAFTPSSGKAEAWDSFPV